MGNNAEKLAGLVMGGRPIIGAAVGTGMAAAATEEGGVDLLLSLNAGYFRAHNCPSMAALLPYADANSLIWEISVRNILPRIRRTPVFIGLCAQDPKLHMASLIKKIKDHSIAGITNFPSVGFIDGKYREALEENGLGYGREMQMLSDAKAAGLMTIGFCFDEKQAFEMAERKMDIINLDLGFAEWRERSALDRNEALNQSIILINRVLKACSRSPGKHCLTVYGGPVVLPQDAQLVFNRTKIRGYIGGSSIERFPASPAIAHTVREFRIASAHRESDRLGSLIGTGQTMQDIFETIRKVALSDAPVLIFGESGTGKELVAREIHRLSRRASKPMVSWNCAATSENLAMSELFGHEKGAFTGADRSRTGRFEQASGTTLFMDEIGDLPLSVQASLLRVIQEKEVIHVGGQSAVPIDVRLIAATNRNFIGMINDEKFRKDLYYRLSTVVIRLPSLRERSEDIPQLVKEFAHEFSRIYDCPVPAIPEPVMTTLMEHRWPGNIRELRSVIERCFILGRGVPIRKSWIEDMLSFDNEIQDAGGRALKTPYANIQSSKEKREKLREVLENVHGNKTAAARMLGVTRKTIYDWMNESVAAN